MICKPDTKTRQRLPHKLEDQADVCSIWALVFKIVNEVADIAVACFSLAPISKMSQDFFLENVCALTIRLSAQDLEGSVLLFIRSEIMLTAISMNFGVARLTALHGLAQARLWNIPHIRSYLALRIFRGICRPHTQGGNLRLGTRLFPLQRPLRCRTRGPQGFGSHPSTWQD